MTFSDRVLERIQPGFKVLDLGAGNGWFAKRCLEHQATVTAVDRVGPTDPSPDIDWHQTDVKEFIERLPMNEQFDVIFTRNLIQFCEYSWVQEKLFPTLIKHLRPKGIIAVQTFYQDPEPPFDSKVSSVYSVEDLKKILEPMQILQSKQYSDHAPDMKGVPRTFFLTNIIAQKT